MISIHHIFESLEKAEAFIARYLSQYPPQGYATSLGRKCVDGLWIVSGSRFSSCD
jgi:hypothetical protein